jgi:hypothetical protein
MRGKSPVLARLVRVSAAVLGAGLLVTACSPVKMGAAAIVGNQRVTIANLDTEVTNLSQTAKLYPGVVQLSAACAVPAETVMPACWASCSLILNLTSQLSASCVSWAALSWTTPG